MWEATAHAQVVGSSNRELLAIAILLLSTFRSRPGNESFRRILPNDDVFLPSVTSWTVRV